MYPTQTHTPTVPAVPVTTTTQPPQLSPKEHELVRALLGGLSNRQLAHEFHLSEQTVKNQLTAIYAKLGIKSRLQLAVYALRHDLA